MENLQIERLKGEKILFACCPADGHFNPLTSLGKHLQDLECEVHWYTSAAYAEKLSALNIPHHPFKHALDINADSIDGYFPERRGISDPIEKINFDMINIFWSRSVEYFEDLTEINTTFAFDLLICDNMFSAIPFVKEKMGIPVVAVGVIPLSQESLNLAPYGMGFPPASNEHEWNEYSRLRELARNVWFKEPSDLFKGILSDYGIQNEKSPGDLLIEYTDRYLQIGTPNFEYYRSDISDKIRFIGALMPFGRNPETNWYDERVSTFNKVILVTQGTVEKDTAKLIIPTLEAFKNTGFLVIATTGGSNTEELKARYPQRNIIIIEANIPFDQVMPHADVFVTNGGYGGTLYGIKHKLPMVAAGVHEGKSEVCARIGYFEYGINLNTEHPEPNEIYDAVDKLLSEDIYKNNVSSLAAEMRDYNSMELSIAAIIEVIEAKESVVQNRA